MTHLLLAKNLRSLRYLALAIALPTLSACGGSGGGNDGDSAAAPTAQYAVTATAAPDFSAGAHSIVSAIAPRAATNNLDASGSDQLVAANGEFFYRIERFGADNIRKYSSAAPGTPLWTFSTDDPGSSFSNVHDMVFADNKAYLIRYGATTAWVVDPAAENEAGFKIGELDLTAYADADGIPEMDSAVIVGNKLFIAMQRFENFTTLGKAYVAVFDITTDTEIDTGTDTVDFRKGIRLPVANPREMVYDADSGLIYLLGGGKLACNFCSPATPAQYTGGIISINPNSYATQMIVNDGGDSDHPYGNLSSLAIVNSGLGYFIGYDDYQDTTLYSFDPSTGAVQATPVAGLAGVDLTAINVDDEAYLWIGKGDLNNPALLVLDTTTNSIEQTISTGLNPQNIAFGEVPAP